LPLLCSQKALIALVNSIGEIQHQIQTQMYMAPMIVLGELVNTGNSNWKEIHLPKCRCLL